MTRSNQRKTRRTAHQQRASTGLWKPLAVVGLLSTAACATAPNVPMPASDEAAVPTADDILQRWLELRSRNGSGELPTTVMAKQMVRIPAINLKSRAETLVDYQNGRMMQHIATRRTGSIYTGVIDGRVFSVNAFDIVYADDADKRASLRSRAHHETDFREWYGHRKYVGREKMNGRITHRIKLVPADTNYQPVERWFDVKTGVLVREEMGQSVEGNQLPVTITYDDYRRVDGFLLPFREVSVVGPQLVEFTTKSVQTNITLPKSRFMPPLNAFNARRLMGLEDDAK